MIQITIPGEPRGKGRPKFARRGRFVTTYTDDKTASYENLIRLAARQAMAGAPPLNGPVRVSVHAWVAVPASFPAWRRKAALEGACRPAGKPDADNILKAVLDGLNGVAYLDDALVCQTSIAKHYAEAPSLVVDVEPIAALAGSRGTKADLEAMRGRIAA